ncbi:MAG: Hpt domain-containing protein [Hahellaceae bacterium]|nr:Hpt domain-containing protein [Hahellaceae bacterium]
MAALLPVELPVASPEETLGLLHSLKGMAATLGAEKVASDAANFEKRLRQRAMDAPSYQQLREQLNKTLFKTCQAIEQRLQQTASFNETATCGASCTELQTAIAHLTTLLKQSNLEALTVFDQFRTLVTQSDPAAQETLSGPLQQLGDAMDRMDFVTAQTCCEQLQLAMETL